MPISLIFKFGATAIARSGIRIEGIFLTYNSPPCMFLIASSTISTACSSLSQKRVILISVIGSSFAPSLTSFWKNGITEPLEPATFPYLTTANFVSCEPQ